MSADRPQTEPTEQGDQMLVAGVTPITTRVPQKLPDSGLFDLAARNQLDLF